MLTILVVDDEYLVRKGIQETITWENYGYKVIGEAGNGEEGLRFAAEHRPDIIITDIRMPFMDGLEFMDKLREAGSDARIIVLSGYGEFEYARAAMTNGAVAYLLKPIENEQLIETVTKVGDALIQDRNKVHYYHQLQSELPTIKKQFLVDLLHGGVSSIDDILAKLALLELPIAVSGLNLIVLIRLDDYKMLAQNISTQTLGILRQTLQIQLNHIFLAHHAFIFEKNPGEWVLIAPIIDSGNPIGLMKEQCKKMFELFKAIPEYDMSKMTFSVGISDPHPTITEMSDAYNEASTAADQKFLPGSNSVVAFADDGAADCRAEIKKAIAYIRANYAQNITAETAARELYISPSHLMHLFKAELGKTFNETLIDYRIEMAKDLMKDPQCRIYEVCEKVGYNDTKYFSQLFKKLTGMSPKDYVKRNM